MKFKELVQMTAEEQDKKLSELQLELIKLNAQVATGTPPKNAGQLKRLKKDIARIMLIIHSKKKLDQKNTEQKFEKRKQEGDSAKVKKEKTGVKKAKTPEDKKKKTEKQNE